VLLSAGIYTILSVLINRVGRQYSPLPPRWILGIFITCDSVATVVQITGAALVGARYSNNEDPTSANDILLGGLAFQVFTFLVFIVLTTLFLYRVFMHKVIVQDGQMRVFIAAFLLATLLVYLRTCFRLAETAQGLQKNLSTHEVYFACLEFAPIAGAVLLFNIWHPGRCLGRPIHGSI
jgi:RTA1 like protein